MTRTSSASSGYFVVVVGLRGGIVAAIGGLGRHGHRQEFVIAMHLDTEQAKEFQVGRGVCWPQILVVEVYSVPIVA